MHETTKATLCRFPGTLFDDIFNGDEPEEFFKRCDGTLFFDRSPRYFEAILNWLRNPDKPIKFPEDEEGRKLLRMELDFYKISGLEKFKELMVIQHCLNELQWDWETRENEEIVFTNHNKVVSSKGAMGRIFSSYTLPKTGHYQITLQVSHRMTSVGIKSLPGEINFD